MMKNILYKIISPVLFVFIISPAFARVTSLDSLIEEIKSSFIKNYNIEQSGTGKVEMLEYSAAVFRKNPALLSYEEYSFKSKKFDYVKRAGKYFKRIALGIYHFNNPDEIKKALHVFLEGHEVNPQKFYKEGKHPALSPPFLVLIKDSTLLFFYAKCGDIPHKKDWDKFTDTYIKIFRYHFPEPEGEIIRCYCSGPIFLVK